MGINTLVKAVCQKAFFAAIFELNCSTTSLVSLSRSFTPFLYEFLIKTSNFHYFNKILLEILKSAEK